MTVQSLNIVAHRIAAAKRKFYGKTLEPHVLHDLHSAVQDKFCELIDEGILDFVPRFEMVFDRNQSKISMVGLDKRTGALIDKVKTVRGNEL